MKKNLLLLCLALLVAVTLLAACTVDGPPAGTDAPGTSAPDTAAGTSEDTDAETAEDYFEVNRIETVAPDTSKFIDMAVTDKGYDIYRLPEEQNWGYR